MRLATLSLTALLLPATALAGNPFASVVKTQEFRQLGPGLVQPVSDIGFAFEVYVDGASTMTPSPTLSGPITMGEPFHNGGALGFNASEGGWGYGAPAFEGWEGPDQATLNGLFGSGTYQLSISGVPVSVPIR